MSSINLGRIVPKPRGDYNKGTLYDVLDIVTCDGASYLCRLETIGNDPPYHTHNKYWLCIAYGSGERGETGMSAYEMAVLNGYRGSEIKWLLSLVGPQGDSGYQGNFTDFLVVNSYDNDYTPSQLQAAALSAKLGKELYERHIDKTLAEYNALVEAGATKDTTFYYIYEEDESAVTYTVILQISDRSQGTVSGGGSYLQGQTATITASAKEGHEFVRWSDGNTDTTRLIIITSNITLTAYFKAIGSEDEPGNVIFEFSNNLLTISGEFSDNLVTISGASFSNNLLTNGLN